MKISLLLKREPFAKVLEQTLSKFLKDRFGHAYEVKWQNRFSGWEARRDKKAQAWFCNPYLNAIFIPLAKAQIFAPIVQEFSRSTKWWRRLFQKAYVFLATNRLTAKCFITSALKIHPPLDGAKNILIMGGNHHIRLLDFNKDCTFVINKSDFINDFLLNEIKVRRENPYLPVPKIQKIANDNSWYSEDLIVAAPINRLKDLSRSREAVESIKQSLFELFIKTKEEKEIAIYTEEIMERIDRYLRAGRLLQIYNRRVIQKKFKDLLNRIKAILLNGQKKIITAQTHGDFQPANILVNNDGKWLIDWEYTYRRQVAYDALVYSLRSRSPKGLNQRFKRALEGRSIETNLIMNNWPFVVWQDKDQRKTTLTLFLLEELELRMKENSNPLFRRLNQGFKTFWEEMEISLKLI